MSIAPRQTIPPLLPGQRLKQPEFHRRYQACPDDVKFELIGGIVRMASPLRRSHGGYSPKLILVTELYASQTPGIEVLDNATTLLDDESEPQHDLELRILSAFGGQSSETADDYIAGAPELIAEVSHATRHLDLGQKRVVYRDAGVIEYLVLDVEKQLLHWFHFPSDETIQPNRRGVAKSRVFPGLWLDVKALLARDSTMLIAAVQKGLTSRAHAAFVKRLQAAHDKRSDK